MALFSALTSHGMSYKAGDCDDLTLLYCALLEGLGVESAFIAIPGHIYAAFALDTAYLEAVRLLIPSDLVIPLDGKAWVPVQITELDGGGPAGLESRITGVEGKF
jgi:transglutaminase-like putative cysteine protease